MPIYEYQCKECGKNFETLVLGQDVPACPSCKSENLSRLLSAFGFKTTGSSNGSSEQKSSFSSSSACSGCTATSCSTCGSA